MNKSTRFALTIRVKALLLLPLVLAIPYVGYQYLREVENFLRGGLEDTLIGTARALASALHEHPELFQHVEVEGPSPKGIYAHPLPSSIEVDGYTKDWAYHLSALRPVSSTSVGAQARYVAGKHGDYLYLVFQVTDDDVVYRDPRSPLTRNSDQLRLVLMDPTGETVAFMLSPISPGRVSAYQIANRSHSTPMNIELRILAAWQPTPTGFAVEIRIPLNLIGKSISFDVVDFDQGDANQPMVRLQMPKPLPLTLPSVEIDRLIARLGSMPGRRVWVLDRSRRVLARAGSLQREQRKTSTSSWYGLILSPPSDEVFEDPPVISHFNGMEVDAAIHGDSKARWRATSEANVWVVSAAYPIWSEEDIVGVVVIEESSVGIQTVTREALVNLFNKTLIVSLVGALALLIFASRIVTRLSRLRDQAESAIDHNGRVIGKLSHDHGSDEIGQMSQSYAAMMERLRQYNQYLENLARRLSHELRTPLAIVRSSLDSLALDPNRETAEVYGARAQEGVTRLDAMLTRMSEAARLEQSIKSADQHIFDLNQLLLATTSAYRDTWSNRAFEITIMESPARIFGVEDLLVQMLDKLVSNAVELGDPHSVIELRLVETGNHYILSVTNFGSQLPQDMQGQLFESMVSVRDNKEQVGPHLGLGLYIARLIADFHHATITARDLDHACGVEVQVSFAPAAPLERIRLG